MFTTYMSETKRFWRDIGRFLDDFIGFWGDFGEIWKRDPEVVSFCEEIIRFDSLFSLVLQVVVYIVFHAVKALLLHIRAAPALEMKYLCHTIL